MRDTTYTVVVTPPPGSDATGELYQVSGPHLDILSAVAPALSEARARGCAPGSMVALRETHTGAHTARVLRPVIPTLSPLTGYTCWAPLV